MTKVEYRLVTDGGRITDTINKTYAEAKALLDEGNEAGWWTGIVQIKKIEPKFKLVVNVRYNCGLSSLIAHVEQHSSDATLVEKGRELCSHINKCTEFDAHFKITEVTGEDV